MKDLQSQEIFIYGYSDRSVRTKLLAAFLVLGLVPLAGVGVFAYRVADSSLGQDAGRRLEDVAFNASDKLDRNLKKNCDITDQPVAALLKDLRQRGLLANTLVL